MKNIKFPNSKLFSPWSGIHVAVAKQLPQMISNSWLTIIINCFGHACTWKQGGQTAADVGGGGEDRGGLGGPVGPPVGSGGSFQEDTKREEEGKCALTGGISRVGGGKDQTGSKSLRRNF